MALTLKRLIEKVSDKEIRLVAGEEGQSRYVTWIHMMESVVTTEFLEENEIVITTGIGLGSAAELMDLVRECDRHHAAAVIVNIGPYINQVPVEAVSYCNQHRLPLYTVPWRIHLSEIIRIMIIAISQEEQREQQTASIFKNAIFFPKELELYIVPLSEHGYKESWNYAVVSVSLLTDKNPACRMSALESVMDSFIQHHLANCCVFLHETELVFVIGNCDNEILHQYVPRILGYLKSQLRAGETYCAGVGKLTRSARCIYKSYRQAAQIRKLHEKGHLNPSLIYYDDMNVYKILMAVEDMDILKEYYDKTIRPLADYDQNNNTDLTATLRYYLKNNCSVKETADELFVHRNTINYKLKKIEDILQKDLSGMNIRTSLSIGLMLQDIL